MIGNRDEYVRMANCERKHWWYRALHEQTLEIMRRHFSGERDVSILDVGCGTGGWLARLSDEGYKYAKGMDLSEDALEFARDQGLDVFHGDIRSSLSTLPSCHCDVITVHDVIYHAPLEERSNLISELLRLLRPGGVVIMNVPAFDVFRGTHDIAVGISDRSTKFRMNRLLSNVEFESADFRYWPFLVSPLIAIVRTWQRTTVADRADFKAAKIASDVWLPNPFFNTVLYVLARFERCLRLYRIWGSSMLITIAKSGTTAPR